MLTDSHCHLHFKNYNSSVNDIINASINNDVSQFLTIAVSLEDYQDALEITNKHHNVYCSIGIHPLYVEEYKSRDIEEIRKNIITACKNEKVIAIGECGLDYYKGEKFKLQQQEFFKTQIECAQETGLPLIIHSREAEADSYKILSEYYNKKKFNAVMHCFTGTKAFAKKCLDLGFYISASGVITYPKAADIANVFRDVVPNDKLLIETDAPYLAPQGKRGKINTPAFLKITAEYLAKLKHTTYQELAKSTTENFNKLFKI